MKVRKTETSVDRSFIDLGIITDIESSRNRVFSEDRENTAASAG